MPASEDYVPLPGRAQAPPHGAHLVGDVDADDVVEVTVLLRPRVAGPGPEEISALSSLPVSQRRYPGRDEYAAIHGAAPEGVSKLEAFAKAHGLNVLEVSLPRRTVVLSGSARAIGAAFRVTLKRYATESGSFRGISGTVSLPAELTPFVEAVIGLDDRPYAHPRGED